jgi:transposase
VNIGIEALFTSALGLQSPWFVEDVKLDTVKRRIDFEVGCRSRTIACPQCGAGDQAVHDRARRSWRHLDFFEFDAWLHADVPRVACTACGTTSELSVSRARGGSSFARPFEALEPWRRQRLPASVPR